MTDAEIAALAAKITEAGLAGKSESALLAGFCERLLAAGLPVARASVIVDTLHPVYEGRVFRWEREQDEPTFSEYVRTGNEAAASDERWRRSPFYRLLETGEPMLHRRLDAESESEFPVLPELRAAGITHYMALVNRFAAGGVIGEMDCVYSSWMTDRTRGFDDRDLAELQRLVPFLALAVKSASLGRIAETLVQTYLGRDAGRRVLSGRIARGIADRIDAVLWFSDLRSFTRISDTSPPEQIIPLLNDYGDAIISAIHEEGGDVLKLIGDGVLAIFPAEERARACAAALEAAARARESVTTLNRRRDDQDLPSTEMYLGLHVGEVFYGNIGSKDRLDFTVIGPAVNEVSRIASMCRSVDQPILISSAFASAIPRERHRFASVGRFALRGVARPQELYTLDPATWNASDR
ncbi:MAG TPA: adenylate/guanylate cyclase domain-containing protein [Stellaceae bacterium]|nr:adenylate/guanylate cyclase domain-containing protein [Stellaceae bacterium]